jgi:hypothetical protein
MSYELEVTCEDEKPDARKLPGGAWHDRPQVGFFWVCDTEEYLLSERRKRNQLSLIALSHTR